MGFIEMCVVSTGPLPNFSPDFMIFDLPYIFKDRDEAFKTMDGEVGTEILKSLEPKGIKALGFWENGFRHISNNKKSITHPEDVKGMKIRTMENPIHQATFKTLGATPTPMAWSEVFVALQQGVIDGQENPLVIMYTTKLYEIQKYISLTGHFYSPAVCMISKQIFDSFPTEIQEAIIKAEKEARDYERQFSAKLDEQLVESLKKEGVTIIEVDKEEWKNACAPVYDQFKSQINPKYLEAILGN
jgi:tripartite ATP-independent transporter DctP family solute receptor